MYKTFLLAFALITGCEAGLEPLQDTETLCTSDSTVCWLQPVGDPRNGPENDPRCIVGETASTREVRAIHSQAGNGKNV